MYAIYGYIWCAMDPIKKYPSHVSIFLPAPWILWVWDKPLGGLAITRPVPKWDDPGKKSVDWIERQ
jgi:hypothetical protein